MFYHHSRCSQRHMYYIPTTSIIHISEGHKKHISFLEFNFTCYAHIAGNVQRREIIEVGRRGAGRQRLRRGLTLILSNWGKRQKLRGSQPCWSLAQVDLHIVVTIGVLAQNLSFWNTFASPAGLFFTCTCTWSPFTCNQIVAKSSWALGLMTILVKIFFKNQKSLKSSMFCLDKSFRWCYKWMEWDCWWGMEHL